jgi:type II secretory pathway pseudopilin PulG
MNHARKAFTLIELLIAMSILMMIVLMVSRLFQQIQTTWVRGAKRAELNMTGRSVADYIARELSQAVTGEYYTIFNVPEGGSTAEFFMLAPTSPTERGEQVTNRAVQFVRYTFESGVVKRSVYSPDPSNVGSYDYSNSLFNPPAADFIDLIPEDTVTNLTFTRPFATAVGELPRAIDVTVAVPSINYVEDYAARAYIVNRNRNR